jgi:hypothetical protein
MSRKRALALAIRCARDSFPPLRLEILLDLAKYPDYVGNASTSLGAPQSAKWKR